jgi:hypothetical protein
MVSVFLYHLFRSLRRGLNSPLPVFGRLRVQFKEAFAEIVGEAKVRFQPESRELLEDDGQDMVLFATEVDGYDIVFGSEVDGQDIVLDE